MVKNRLVNNEEGNEEQDFEISLRPNSLNEYIGQAQIKSNLEILLQAAKQRSEPVDHILLYGPPGLGKTTLAHVIANEHGSNIKVTSGPALERAGDLASILTNLQRGDILFIDEIHRLNKIVEEVLYPAMEDYALDIIIGKGPSARTVRLDLPRFTIIGATTKMSLLTSPLRDRFGVIYRLQFYQPDDIQKIVTRSAKLLNTNINNEATDLIAKRARATPRIANRLLKRVRDYAQVKSDGTVNESLANQALDLLAVDGLGLDQVDRHLLETIINKFNGGPVGLNTLAAATAEEEETIEDVYEPFLMQLGFIERTPRGRRVTKLAYDHLDLKSPNNQGQFI